ncbi:MAG: efflux RND transporter periplasmic adaptor subunit [Bacteroidetes bacterium]|jgi:membrane fusion protein, copper/silver efflux system|nr:efflux RND transporter periplasmic adaptor subunit [Bacteroidota bacterium]MBT6686861.1 efflux RND transporter periplasmic adaptor subunit [Bacteroidota bacterium]MBT7142588.1 efflux RND transporter periplasmic adaptor subunit [Bacteroidota bacterium]MBT7491855.1 efflux RND transporter periplasmic adaptor subunit [Bacteroidota bacterium]
MKSNIFKIGIREIVIIAITLVIGISLGSLFFGSSSNENHEGHNHSESETVEPTTWICSMHPQIKQDKLGDCPICGMDLIPLKTDDAGEEADPNEIQMTESAMKLAEVQTYIVKSGDSEKAVHLLGKVKPDERNIATLTARFGGRIEKLYVNYTGQNVRKGQKLASIYSPELNTAQQELLDAAKYKRDNPSFYKATRNKLKLWELTDTQIDDIENSDEPSIYFDILSPISGTITRRNVSIGNYVKEGSPLFEVIDLSRIWIMFDAYESDLPWIKMGNEVSFTLQSLPGNSYSAKVSYIDPFIDANTRVAQLRVEMSNPNLDFKPEMFVNGILQSKTASNSEQLLIPKTSILWTGKRAVVYVKVANRETPSFIHREITLGPETGSFYVVANGLKEGEEIASNGVFKIDASAQLLGKQSMMNPEDEKVSTGHNHGDNEMSNEEMENNKKPNVSISEKVDEKFKNQLGTFVNAYLKMKDAFVATDEKAVEIEAVNLLANLNKVDMSLLKDDAHNQWMKLLKPIKDNINSIISMEGIEMKRSHFSIISNKIIDAIEIFGISTNNTFYLEYCSMAFDNKGGFWISKEPEIKNPYFGDIMLKCGEVKKQFNK